MIKGLTVWKNTGKNSILLDGDNVFWGIINRKSYNNSGLLIPRDMLSLYERLKGSLDREMHDFRFSQELTAVYIDVTDRCNARCPYCYIPERIRKNGRSMNEKELAFILRKIAKYFKRSRRKPVIVFHASEPLLVKDVIFTAINKFQDKFSFGLQTNALLLKRQDVEFLKEHRVGVGISLDSLSPFVNNRLRRSIGQGGNFNQAVRAIELFNGYEGLNVITTLTKFNVSGLPDLVKFLHTKKVPCVLLNPVRLTQANSRKLRPDEEAMTKYFIRAVDQAIRCSMDSKRQIIVGNFTNIILGIVAPVARRLMCDISPCGGGRCFFTITASGEMIPCGEFIGLNGFSGGNIFKNSIEEGMQSAAFRKIRARIAEKIPECSSCIFRNICGAPCPAELHSLGNMRQPSVFCGFYKEIIKYAFKLISEGKEKYCLRKEGSDNLEYEYCLD